MPLFNSTRNDSTHYDVENAASKESQAEMFSPFSDLPASTRSKTDVEEKKPRVSGSKGTKQHNSSYTPRSPRSSDRLWSLYNAYVKQDDDRNLARLKADMDSLLIFAGLFSATVTAFIIESYKNLALDPQDATVAILTQMSIQLAALTNTSLAAEATPARLDNSFQPTNSSVHTNTLWTLSLILSLTCAMGATLVQMWIIRYSFIIQFLAPKFSYHSHRRAHNNQGPFRLSLWTSVLHSLLHVSLYLFLAGLVTFFQPFSIFISHMTEGVLIAWGVLYASVSIAPLFDRNSPYITPLTMSLQLVIMIFYVVAMLMGILVMMPLGLLAALFTKSYATFERWSNIPFLIFRDMKRVAIALPDAKSAPRPSVERDQLALQWVMNQLGDDDEFIRFLEDVNDYLDCPTFEDTTTAKIVLSLGEYNTGTELGESLGLILRNCVDEQSLDRSNRFHYADVCMTTLRKAFLQSTKSERLSDTVWMEWCTKDVLESVNTLSQDLDASLALRARCTATVLLHQALSDCSELIEFSNNKDVRIEVDWTLRQMVLGLQDKFWVGYIHQLTVVALLLPDLGISPCISNADEAFGHAFTGVIWDDDEVPKKDKLLEQVIVAKRRLMNEGSLYVLNNFLAALLTQPVLSSDLNLLRDTMRVVVDGWEFEGTTEASQRVFIKLLSQIASENIASDHHDFQVDSIRGALLPSSIVEMLISVAAALARIDSQCSADARLLVESYEHRHTENG